MEKIEKTIDNISGFHQQERERYQIEALYALEVRAGDLHYMNRTPLIISCDTYSLVGTRQQYLQVAREITRVLEGLPVTGECRNCAALIHEPGAKYCSKCGVEVVK